MRKRPWSPEARVRSSVLAILFVGATPIAAPTVNGPSSLRLGSVPTSGTVQASGVAANPPDVVIAQSTASAPNPAAEAILSPPAPEDVKERPIEERPARPMETHFVLEGTEANGDRQSVIGDTKTHAPEQGETFLEISRDYDLGYNEIVAANPGLDPWVPDRDVGLLIPTEWVLPRAPHEGVVVNIPEMRLYYFVPSARKGEAASQVVTYPVGLGRQDWQTPQAEFRIRGKTRDPTWVIPESIKRERIEKQGFTEDMIPGGHPDNPLGKYRIELTLPMYGIHGSNKEWGVGMQISHGCIRMFPEDIETLFSLVQIGSPGRFVYQPIKLGIRDGRVMVEVHEDIYGVAPWPWMLAQDLVKEMGLERQVDRERLEAAVEAATGVPTDVGHVKWPEFGGGTQARFDEQRDPLRAYPPTGGAN